MMVEYIWKRNSIKLNYFRFRYLSHWYGLREFLILAPKRNNDAITDEDRANLLLSSTAIAVSNVGW